MDEVMYGPMQLFVIGFPDPNFQGQIRREFESAMEKGIIRLIDLLFVWKDKDGNLTSIATSQLDEEERKRFGAVVGGLIGYGAGGKEGAKIGMEEGSVAAAEENYGITEEDIADIAEAIPEGSAAGIFIIEHLWAKNLKQALRNAGGVLVFQDMISPEMLIMVGDELREAVMAAGE
jgi:uncharacterized membrane protein